MRGDGAAHQRVAVRRRLGHIVRPQGRPRARLVFHHHRLAQALGQFLPQCARQHVGRAAGRERHDQLDGLGRPGASLRHRCRRQQDQQAGRRRGQDGKASVRHGFVLLHGCLLMVVVGISPGVRV
ncbi:hypothetical protein G6F31_019549 [Rhizopus arrhizus]|nr:hypothetical protein G6F31_019549 [Rhizopus arrhizus]